MEKLEHQSLTQRVYYKVRELIASGVLQPGARIDERLLSEELMVSRTPLREAIGKLAKEGFVEHRPYKGNFIRAFTVKQVNDLFELRTALEALAVQLAVPKLSEQDLSTLRSILDDTQVALERGDMVEYSTADQRFHGTLAHLSDNESLVEALGLLKDQVQLVRLVANQDPGVVERTARQRPQILAALEARDAESAAQLMKEHIEDVRRNMVAQVEAPANSSGDRAV